MCLGHAFQYMLKTAKFFVTMHFFCRHCTIICMSMFTLTAINQISFQVLRQFSVHKLSCQMNFYKMMNFQLTPLSKNFLKSCMFLPLLCLGTILAPTCPASCQPSCSPPTSSGSVGAAWFHPFSCSTMAPMRSCTTAPLLHHPIGSRDEVVALAADDAPGRPLGSRPGGLAATKRVSFSDPLVSSPSPSLVPPRNGPGTIFLPGEEVFARPGPAAPSQPPLELDFWPLLLLAEARARGELSTSSVL